MVFYSQWTTIYRSNKRGVEDLFHNVIIVRNTRAHTFIFIYRHIELKLHKSNVCQHVCLTTLLLASYHCWIYLFLYSNCKTFPGDLFVSIFLCFFFFLFLHKYLISHLKVIFGYSLLMEFSFKQNCPFCKWKVYIANMLRRILLLNLPHRKINWIFM